MTVGLIEALQPFPCKVLFAQVRVGNAQPLYTDRPVGHHHGVRKKHPELLCEIKGADEVSIQVLSVLVRIAQANQCDDIIRVATDALVCQD